MQNGGGCQKSDTCPHSASVTTGRIYAIVYLYNYILLDRRGRARMEKRTYAASDAIHFDKLHRRSDIGARALAALKARD